MKINMSKIKNYEKVLSSFDGNFVFIDAKDSKLYLNSATKFMVLNLDISDLKEDEKKVYPIDKDEFIHTLNFTNIIDMNKDCSYVDDKNTVKGTFKHNNDYVDLVDSIKEKMNDDGFEEAFTYSDEIVKSMNRASIFIDPQNIKSDFRYLDIKDNHVFSSTGMKIYINKIDVNNNCILSGDILKFISLIPNVIVSHNNNQEFIISNEDISIYFGAPESLNFIPVLGDFKNRYSSIYDTTCIKVNAKELISKLDYISYYAQTISSTRVELKSNNDEITLSVGDNSTKLDITSIISNEDGELDVPFNSSALLNAISKLYKEDDISIYISKDNSKKLFILKFDESEEEVILCKLQE